MQKNPEDEENNKNNNEEILSDVLYFYWNQDEFIINIGPRKENSFPVELNPYKILKLKKDAKSFEIDLAFKNNLFKNPQFRSEICLAYEMLNEPNLSNSLKYIKLNENTDNYRAINHDEFYCAVVGDKIGLSYLLIQKKNIINEKDQNGRSLLHIASTNGHLEVCSFLLENGANVNEFDNNHCIPLHSAVYHGHENIIKLLISYGADVNQKNDFGETPEEEAPSNKYKDIIKECRNDVILKLYYKLKLDNLVERIVKVKRYNKFQKTDEFIAIKFIPCYELLLPDVYYTVWKNWDPAWHGTKFENIESILRNGLKEAGSRIIDGKMIKPKDGHIQFGVKVNNINDWANAIFASPSIFYSTHPIYAERIKSDFFGGSWAVLIETRLKPGTYGSFHTTTTDREIIDGEPSLVEFRVSSVDKYTLEKNIHIIAITFVLDKFLQNVKEYDQGGILSNTQEERIIFDN